MHTRVILFTCILSSTANVARAYSDPSMFAVPALEGGGEGRWFTGSSADGHTCAVCHRGALSVPIAVAGLPIDGYDPGASYEVIVDWPDALEHVGLNLEITDADSRAAGTIQLPAGPTLDDRERCVPYGADIAAGFIADHDDSRSIVSVADCGALRVRFLWTAPVDRRDQLWLNGSLVAADGMADFEGDGVTTFTRPLVARGETPIVASLGGCATAPIQRSAFGSWWLFLLVLTRRIGRRASRLNA